MTDSPCASCVSVYGRSCCELKMKGQGDLLLPMSYGEAEAIADHFSTSVSEVVDMIHVSPATEAALHMEVGPDVSRLIVDGFGLFLPLQREACRYLGPEGCTIPSVKPTWCATFPFHSTRNGWRVGLLVSHAGYCFGQDSSGGSTMRAIKIFGVTDESLDTIAKRRDEFMKDHPRKMREAITWLRQR